MTAPQPAANASAGPQKKGIPVGLIAGVAALVVVLVLPLPATLPPAGQRMLAILAFAVVVWLTEAVSYEASAIIITSLMAFLVGTAPTIENPAVDYGTNKAISMALAGFSNSALALVAGGFASATALTSAMLPILVSVLQSMQGDFNRLGLTMLLGFVVSFGFILPINAPQNMVCLATETFTAKQFARVGIVLTIVGYLLLLLFGATWWRWLGWI